MYVTCHPSTGLGEPPQNSRRDYEKVEKTVSPGVMKIKKMFENKNIREKEESKEAVKESNVKQLSNTFESMMDRGRRKTTDRVEKQIRETERTRENRR